MHKKALLPFLKNGRLRILLRKYECVPVTLIKQFLTTCAWKIISTCLWFISDMNVALHKPGGMTK